MLFGCEREKGGVELAWVGWYPRDAGEFIGSGFVGEQRRDPKK